MPIEFLLFCPLSTNKSTMMISRTHHGEFVDWATIMYSQLVKELIKWGKCQKNMIEGTTKRKPKKDVCHFPIVLKIMFQKWFPLEGAKPQKKKKNKQNSHMRIGEERRV
jgi:hypothetical protein